MKYTIDAQGKKIGRVASEAATALMGKNTPLFERHISSGVEVHIINVSKANVSEKKAKTKRYDQYSGHPGGLRRETMWQVIEKKGYAEIFRRAVYGMLPSNKLRAPRMKQLIITE